MTVTDYSIALCLSILVFAVVDFVNGMNVSILFSKRLPASK